MVLVLFETAVGYCLFSLSDEGKVNSPDLYKTFESESEANRLLQLSAIHRFQSTVEAVEGATAINEGKLSKDLKKFLQREILEKGGSAGAKGASTEKLLVSEPKLGTSSSLTQPRRLPRSSASRSRRIRVSWTSTAVSVRTSRRCSVAASQTKAHWTPVT